MVGKKHSFDAWRESLRTVYDVNPLTEEARGTETIQAWLVDNLIFTNVRFSRQSFSHNARHMKDANYLSLQIYTYGISRGQVQDTQFETQPGDIHIFDFSREFHSVAEDSVVAGVVIPHDAIGYDPGRHPPHFKFQASQPLTRFLTGSVLNLLDELPLFQQSDAHALSESFLGLLRGILAFDSSETSDMQEFRAERRAAIRSYMDRHLSDPNLGVEQLCRIFGVSRPSIYREFADSGGIARYITQRRLDRAYFQLISTPPRHGRVREIANRWGFDDPAHFSRIFTRRFGIAPSDTIRLSRTDDGSELLAQADSLREMGNWFRGISGQIDRV